MQLDAVRTLTNGTVDPDPGVASTISAGLVFATRQRQPNSDVPNTVLVLALEAPAAETVTVDLYAVIEDSAPPQDVGNLPGAVPSARFFLIATGVVVTGSRLLARECFLGGQIYARVTADTLTTPRKLHATCAPGQASEAASGATVVTTTQLPTVLGQQAASGSLSVVESRDQEWLLSASTALEASRIIKASAGTLRALTVRLDSTAGSATFYVQLYNSATLPADGAARLAGMKVVHTSGTDDRLVFDFAEHGIRFSAGIVVALSTTPFTKTIAGAFLDVEGAEYS